MGFVNSGICFGPKRGRQLSRCATRRVWVCLTYYEVLGVEQGADVRTIKKAYRKEALRNHPDVSKDPGASDKFMQVQEAYKVLSDPKLRSTYDLKIRMGTGAGFGGSKSYGTSNAGNGFKSPWSERDGPFPEDLNDSFGSIFSDLFSTVSKAASDVGSTGTGGIASDFVEFLEKQVGINSNGDGLDDMLKNGTIEELESELSDNVFVLEQLEAREKRLHQELESAERLEIQWRERSQRAGLDFDAKKAAADRAEAFSREQTRDRKKLNQVVSMKEKQKVSIDRIKAKLATMEGEAKAREDVKTATEVARNTVKEERERVKKDVEDELQRMKRELGL
ncbi:hypothetical protein NDN08_002526 [Rhodosorus marinus]|uniref:J domain-containing protein n=1 Tax=Rhodosorus marinus TaxID=101924 RepID=A0AAV8UZQ5_9RHOD|nr:hypothetical protein NDN08_002526 [Rhodosorus marinus]